MLDRVGDGDRGALGNAEQSEAIERDCANDSFKIAQPRVEGKILDIPVG